MEPTTIVTYTPTLLSLSLSLSRSLSLLVQLDSYIYISLYWPSHASLASVYV